MNSKLTKQVNRIFDPIPETQQKKRIAYLQAYQARRQFLDKLNAELDKMEFESRKDRSRYYSNMVAKFDSQYQEVF